MASPCSNLAGHPRETSKTAVASSIHLTMGCYRDNRDWTHFVGGLRAPVAVNEKRTMSIKLFVGGLNFSTDTASLRRGFERFGEVDDVAVINDRDTGRSRGFGFVTFEEDEAADKAVAALNGTELDGRTIRVDVAQAKERSHGGGGGHRTGGNGW